MRWVAVGALLSTFAALPALAQMAEVDIDGDGNASFQELVAAYPETTEVQFQTLDADGDGVLSDTEMAAALEAGTLVELAD